MTETIRMDQDFIPNATVQCLSVMFVLFVGVILAPIISFVVFYFLYQSIFWPLPVLYITFVITIDRLTSSRGGRRKHWWRNLTLWKHFCSYFPIQLIKTSELDPKKNYIFGFHPHGIIPFSAVGNFCSEATGFSEKFPGITPYFAVLNLLFAWPVFRDMFMFLGMCDVSKKSIKYLCDNESGGNAVAISIGGAAESLEARPGSCRIHLKERKGFVKIALLTGAQLVPVYSFGENDAYDQLSNSKESTLRRIQERIRHWLTFAIPIFYGRGFRANTFGLLPYRRRMCTVVGAPIEVTKQENPSQVDIDDLHSSYMERLKELFDTHKQKYSAYPNAELEVI